MQAKLPLEAVTLVLKELKGRFIFETDHGEFVVLRKEDYDNLRVSEEEQQLELPTIEVASDADGASAEVEEINRTLAMNAEEDIVDDLAIDTQDNGASVKFEPIKGDLPPEMHG